MPSFEQAFNSAENVATSTFKASTDLAKLARQMQKASQEGNIAAIKRAAEKLNDSLGTVRQEVANAVAAWPFRDEEEEQYLRDGYVAELRSEASRKGLEIHEKDGQLISYPSILRMLPSERSVRIDRKKVSTIRPSKLVAMLIENQKKRPRFSSDRFLEAVHNAYKLLAVEQRSGRLIDDPQGSPVVSLMRIYEVFTSLPGINREYSQTDFARDVYFLDSSGIRATKSGAQVSFPASTGTRGGSRATLSFVGPDGHQAIYYGVRFAGGS